MGIAALTDPLFRDVADHERRRALRTLGLAAVLGIVTHALFRNAGLGLNFFLWTVLLVGAHVAAFHPPHRGRIRPLAWGAMAVALYLAFTVVRFESTWAVVIAVPTTLAVLAILPMLLRDGLDLEGLAGVPLRLVRLPAWMPRAFVQSARLPGVVAGSDVQKGATRFAKGLVIGMPIAGFFTLLFSSDSAFSDALSGIHRHMGEAFSILMWTVSTSGFFLLTGTMYGLESAPMVRFMTPALGPYRHGQSEAETPFVAHHRGWVAPGTWALVLGQVALVFALFVGVNLRSLFGGHALVRAAHGPTYASYLHSGFGQFLFATILSVCLVAGGHRLLRRDAREDVPGGRLLVSVEVALVALTAITLLSCWQRLRIYDDAYGATEQRLGVALIEIAVGGLLALTLAKALRRRWRGYGGAVIVLAGAMAVVGASVDADAYVARTNLDRAARGAGLDEEYLAELGPDARVVLDHPVLQANPLLRSALAHRYCKGGRTDWRATRGLGRCWVTP